MPPGKPEEFPQWLETAHIYYLRFLGAVSLGLLLRDSQAMFKEQAGVCSYLEP